MICQYHGYTIKSSPKVTRLGMNITQGREIPADDGMVNERYMLKLLRIHYSSQLRFGSFMNGAEVFFRNIIGLTGKCHKPYNVEEGHQAQHYIPKGPDGSECDDSPEKVHAYKGQTIPEN